jgi:hypothetical protein
MGRLMITLIIISLLIGCGSGERMRYNDDGNTQLKTQEKQVLLEIDGQVWKRVADFNQSGPGDWHYVVVSNQDGSASIRFGDGQHGKRLPAGKHNFDVTYRSHKNYSEVVMQEGRVILDDDWNEQATATRSCLCGTYRAMVINNQDPLGKKRLMVQIPTVSGTNQVWALPSLADTNIPIPQIGTGVWVVFEQGDVYSPVWIGRME